MLRGLFVLFVVVYWPLQFLSELSDFLSALVLRTDKVFIVGDLNIHVDIENNSFRNGFITLLEPVGFLPTDKSTDSQL